MSSPLTFPPHPILKAPTPEQIVALSKTPKGKEALIQWHKNYTESLEAAKDNPVECGFVLDQQKKVEKLLADPQYDEVWVLGGHRSGKSRSAAKIIMETLEKNPGTEIMCWSQNEKTSIERQQPYLWEMMPKKYKEGRLKDKVAFINWSKASGFTQNKFILPNGSVCYFYFYSQFQNDDSVAEGANLGLVPDLCNYTNVGCWMDEYLGTEELVSRMRSRCSEKNAKILLTFTPMRGYTPCVASVLDRAKTLESAPASLLDGKPMPVVQKCEKEGAAVVFYHSEQNPFSNFKRLARNLSGQPDHVIKKIAYGYPTKSMTAMFTTFDEAAHVYDPEEEFYDFKDKKRWTVYHIIDPAGARSWANGWIAVSDKDEWRAFAEFPDRDRFGDWAEEAAVAKRDGDAIVWRTGPAAKDLAGMSFNEMKIEWATIEGDIPVFERVIDSRFVHNPRSTATEGRRTLQDDLFDEGIETVVSDGGEEEDGLALIHQLLALPNPNKEFHPHTNCPKLRFSKNCGNWIFCVQNYCKNGKKDEPLKDFIDILRYAARHNGGNGLEHYDENDFKQESGGWGY